jgi:hypothetical protein
VPDQDSIAIFVKLEYSEVYRATVVLTVRQFRKLLIIWGIVAALMLALFVFALIRPMPGKDWYETSRNARPLLWAFGLPLGFVFAVPLLTARKAVSDERIRKGISYQFSDVGIHLESSVATSDLQWSAFRNVIEMRSAFLLLSGASLAHILPKRCFASEADIVAMRELLSGRFPKAKLRHD